MIFSEIKLFELLKTKLGEKEAEVFIEALEKKVKLEERKIEYVLEKELQERLLTKTEAGIMFPSKDDFARVESRLGMRILYLWIGQIVLFGCILLFLLLKTSGY